MRRERMSPAIGEMGSNVRTRWRVKWHGTRSRVFVPSHHKFIQLSSVVNMAWKRSLLPKRIFKNHTGLRTTFVIDMMILGSPRIMIFATS